MNSNPVTGIFVIEAALVAGAISLWCFWYFSYVRLKRSVIASLLITATAKCLSTTVGIVSLFAIVLLQLGLFTLLFGDQKRLPGFVEGICGSVTIVGALLMVALVDTYIVNCYMREGPNFSSLYRRILILDVIPLVAFALVGVTGHQ